MKIYIPKHIRSLPIIDNLRRMMSEYSKRKTEKGEDIDSFSGYKDSLKVDPVYKFLSLVFPEGWTDKETKLTYLSNLFYRVKGTYKVIDFLVSFGVLGSWEGPEGKATYNGRKIVVYIPKIKFDRDLYCTYLKNFLDTLLFFDELFIEIGEIDMEVKGDVSSRIEHGTFNYRCYEG